MTYREAMLQGEGLLASAGIAEAKNDAWLLLAFLCKISRTYYLVHMNDEIAPDLLGEYTALILKRAERVPLQYITGEQAFMGLTFKVNNNVLIPRQDTETLVEEALKLLKPGMKVLDMCTGSGCIIISLVIKGTSVSGTGADISKAALAVARENARNNNAAVAFEHSNLFSQIRDKYDMIVSNPPYIPTDDIPGLMPEVADFEPHLALDGEADGLAFYRRITEQAAEFLYPGGWLCYEIGNDQGEAVSGLMEKAGFTNIRVIKDLAGNDRVVTGKRKE